MNHANIKKLISHLRELSPDEFNMDTWLTRSGDGCGTVACIGGWAAMLSGEPLQMDLTSTGNIIGRPTPIYQAAMYWLDICWDAAQELFLPGPGMGDVTQEEACGVLERLMERGHVSWSEVLRERA